MDALAVALVHKYGRPDMVCGYATVVKVSEGATGDRLYGAAMRRSGDRRRRDVVGAQIENELRRGRDHMKVTVAVAVTAPDVASAPTARWDGFCSAASDETGWDSGVAAAEVVPVARLVMPILTMSSPNAPTLEITYTCPARMLAARRLIPSKASWISVSLVSAWPAP